MVVRDVYTTEEENMISEWKERVDIAGWVGEEPTKEVPYPVFSRVATQHLILSMANTFDYSNPLWRDEKYARNTRWGGIIAPPLFEDFIMHGSAGSLPHVPANLGAPFSLFLGRSWQFFKPIRVNDSFRIWNGHNTITDVTSNDGKGPRAFLFSTEDRYINQKSELVATVVRKNLITIMREAFEKSFTDGKLSMDPSLPRLSEYKYTKRELEYIDSCVAAEKMRGSKIRYWEDFKVGEELQPTVFGPITVWDVIMALQCLGVFFFPMKEVCKRTPNQVVIDPVTGVSHKTIENHFLDRTAHIEGRPQAVSWGRMLEHHLCRLITNWMGDDGCLKRFTSDVKTSNTIGDTVFNKGKVVKKYVDADGEHVVDLVVWLENMRGNVGSLGKATVGLLSKGNIDSDLIRY
jgi:acyl dehydratase